MGLGLQYAVTPNWSTKLEYNYLGFGSKELATSCVFGCNETLVQSFSSNIHLIKVGIDYKFF
jgi:opacity protein-like surface antigen